MSVSGRSAAHALAAASLLFWGAADAPAQAVRPRYAFIDTTEVPRPEAPPGPGRLFLLSAVAPGVGQYRLGSGRWAPYVAIEVWSWFHYLDRQDDGRDFERRYRNLAWSVARRGGAQPRRDGDFAYYEALDHFTESGAFDLEPARPGIQPEEDETTFNGSIWALARAIYFPADVETLPDTAAAYQEALAYYQEHAVGPGFAWSWRGRAAEQERYGELIHESDEALRSATRTLGLILANHLVSAVDALISARLSGDERESPVEVRSGFTRSAGGPGWSVSVRLALPRR
ncbi:MAG TPA: hypothetical protein VF188_07680 [Longimicrobiales bacterium]